jgi:ribosomal protein S18 acetylase RimI-like enzyme
MNCRGSGAARSTSTGSPPAALFLVLASEQGVVVGYALVCIEQGPDDTFPLGPLYAELYSLSVAPRQRGRGIGSGLLDFIDQELERRSIEGLKVAVMTGNTDALRLYERRGLRLAELVLYRFAAPGAEADAREAGLHTG